MRESNYISETPISYRKDYGQFFTPSSVAQMMATYVMKDDPKTILDPAFGLGIFYEVIININPIKNIQFTGYEIDERILSYFHCNNDTTNLTIIKGDFLESEMAYFDAVICNPPYMRFQKFLKRHDVLPICEKQIGKKLAGYSNIASVFLVKALKELKPNGRLAFIMPFEFFNTGYGKEIKKSLLEKHLLKQIVTFSNEKEIFPEATTTVCVLFCKNDEQSEPVKISHIKTNEEICNISDISDFYQRKINPSDLPYNKKWTPIIKSLFSEQEVPDGFCKLSIYGAFTRGIATGANDFFALTKSKIAELNIDDNNISKCITKSQQIRKAIFTEDDFYVLYNADKPVYCLDIKDHNKEAVINYIKLGEKLGYHQRYLTKKRSPWYKLEHRTPAPILFGVFNRGRLKVIRHFTTAINFTCYHSFYPNMFGYPIINKLFVYLLSDIGQRIIQNNKRSYGNKLDKFEPGDLNDSLCPNPNQFEMIDESEAARVIEVAQTDENLAIQMSNNLIVQIINAQQCAAPDGNSV
ncbi:MAG: N-6 DNA methylase [Pseudomonadota bacterium]